MTLDSSNSEKQHGILPERDDFAADITIGANPIIAHSHLRWDFVWQRPQQILSRLSQRRRVLFVEEPLWLDDASRPSLHVTQAMPNVHRVIPRLPSAMRDGAESDIAVRTMVKALIGEGGELAGAFRHAVQWFCTPMAAPAMLDAFNERAVVYDCMDELSKFQFAPAQLVLRERYLLSRADIVFTGGRKLFETKSRHHDNVHFVGSGVDVEHFAKARDVATTVAPEIASLGGPVLGYFGVIDERLDFELIAAVARALPHASIAMVGPVVKVSDELPQAPNLHWLGQRDYSVLPSIVKGFDVCLMPFALNDATEFINPTKTLEYMAAGRPVVSTPVADVVRNFGSCITIAESVEAFVAAAMANASAPDLVQLTRAAERAAQSSWTHVVDEMSRHVDRTVAARGTGFRSRSARVAAAATHGGSDETPEARVPAAAMTHVVDESMRRVSKLRL